MYNARDYLKNPSDEESLNKILNTDLAIYSWKKIDRMFVVACSESHIDLILKLINYKKKLDRHSGYHLSRVLGSFTKLTNQFIKILYVTAFALGCNIIEHLCGFCWNMVPYYIAKYGYLESEAGYYLYYLCNHFPGEIDFIKKVLLNNKIDSKNLHRCFYQALYKGKLDVLDMLYENTDIDVSDPEFFITSTKIIGRETINWIVDHNYHTTRPYFYDDYICYIINSDPDTHHLSSEWLHTQVDGISVAYFLPKRDTYRVEFDYKKVSKFIKKLAKKTVQKSGYSLQT